MKEAYFKSKEFDLSGFMSELDGNELMLLSYLIAENFTDLKAKVLREMEGMNHFKSLIDKKSLKQNKAPEKQELINEFLHIYGDDDYYKSFYHTLYIAELSNGFIFNMKVFLLKGFTNIMFDNRMNKMKRDMMSSLIKNETFDTLSYVRNNLLFKDKPYLNSIYLINFLSILDFSSDEFVRLFEGKEVDLFLILIEQFDLISKQKTKQEINDLKKELNKSKVIENNLLKKESALNKNKEQLKNANEEIKRLTKSLGEINKYKVDISVVNDIKKEMIEKEAEALALLQKTIKQHDKEKSGLYKQITKLNEDMNELRRTHRKELNQLQLKLDEIQNISIEEELKNYLDTKGLTSNLKIILEKYIEMNDFKEDIPEQSPVVEEVIEPKPNFYIGYYLYEDEKDYIVLPNKKRIEILNIPESTYLSPYQFVKVTSEGEYRWSFNYIYKESEKDYQIAEFTSTVYKKKVPYCMLDYKETKLLKNVPAKIRFMNDQIIAIDKYTRFLSYYLPIKYNIDYYMDSIKQKEHIAYYVLNVFENGLMLRNIETGNESFEMINLEDKIIEPQQIIIVSDKRITLVIKSSKYYTMSTYYKKSDVGTIKKQDDNVFLQKISGEVVLLNNIPITLDLSDEDIVRIDEFNNLLEVIEYKDNHLSDERRKLNSNNRFIQSKKTQKSPIKINGEILILGNISYENSYKMALYKNGNRAEVLDGFESWTKVKSALKDKDLIVVISEFISHENMWNLKKEVNDIPIIYPESDGANRIVDMINASNILNQE